MLNVTHVNKRIMKTKIFTLGILFLFHQGMGTAQSFLNGSFENTTGNCDFNISNSTFNGLMNDCYAFGEASQIDIIKNTCGYGSAQSGIYFIGLAVSISLQADALSLSLDEPLTAGNSYALSFYSEKSLSYATNHSGYRHVFRDCEPGEHTGLSQSVWRLHNGDVGRKCHPSV